MKKWIIIVLIVVALGLAAYWWFYWRNIPAAPTTTPESDQSKIMNLTDTSFPLTPGAKGIQVLYLQAYLNRFKNQNVALDGILGPQTWSAYKSSPFYGDVTNGDLITQDVYNNKIKPHQGLLTDWMREQGVNI